MNKYQLLIFDWDGTLMDSLAFIVHCIKQAATHLGLPVPDDLTIRTGIGLSASDQVHRLYPDIESYQHQQFIDQYRYNYYSVDDRQLPRLFDGVPETLRLFKEKGFLMAIATSKSRKGLEESMIAHNLETIFDVTRCCDDGYIKPHPEILFSILKELGVTKEKAVMIGDTIYDMQLANNAGVDSLGVSYGVHRREQLEKYSPVAVVSDIMQLPGLLG